MIIWRIYFANVVVGGAGIGGASGNGTGINLLGNAGVVLYGNVLYHLFV